MPTRIIGRKMPTRITGRIRISHGQLKSTAERIIARVLGVQVVTGKLA